MDFEADADKKYPNIMLYNYMIIALSLSLIEHLLDKKNKYFKEKGGRLMLVTVGSENSD